MTPALSSSAATLTLYLVLPWLIAAAVCAVAVGLWTVAALTKDRLVVVPAKVADRR